MSIDIIYCDKILNENQEFVEYFNNNQRDVDYYIGNFDLDILKNLVIVIQDKLEYTEINAYTKTKLKKELIAMILAIKSQESIKKDSYSK